MRRYDLWLAVLGSLMVVPLTICAKQATRAVEKETHGTILINSQPAGSYAEKTRTIPSGIESTVESTIIFNRLGSKVEYKVSGVYRQNEAGDLAGAHCEMSSSKSPVLTDVDVRGSSLQIKIKSGDKEYSRTVPFSGELIGPEASRRLMSQLSDKEPEHSYQTFLCETGDMGFATVKYMGRETLVGADGNAITAMKVDESLQGFPGATKLWLNSSGDMLKMQQTTPFGPMETMIDGKNTPHASPPGVVMPEESYQGTMAVSNIRIPDPRQLQEVELELTQRKPELGWPNFEDKNQRVLAKSLNRVVLRIRKPKFSHRKHSGSLSATDAASFSAANALLQSDDDRIVKIAKQVTQSASTPWQAALSLQKWTSENMNFDAGIAVAPASEIVTDRHGTCVGYSILLASLLRAAHLPSRIKMGYVYDGGVWGGHAWVEAYVNDAWVPLDAAEYFPGPSDAARFSAVSMSGQNGSLEGIGELAKLYGNIDVRILGYTAFGEHHQVPADAKDYVIQGNIFRNPWLGITVTKDPSMSFTHLDEHWPNNTILEMERPGKQVSLFYSANDPDLDLRAQARRFSETHGIRGDDQPIRWGKVTAIQTSAKEASSVAAVVNGSLWVVTFKGPDAANELKMMLGHFAIDDLRERRGWAK